MLFNTLEFFLFFFCFCYIYWAFRSNLTIQNILLLLGSYTFYGLWDFRFLSLILISSLTDYFVGYQLGKSEDAFNRRILLFVSVFINLGILFTFKYYGFFIQSLSDLLAFLNLQLNISTLNVILPVGISFYTFQTMSYTLDVYHKRLPAHKNLLSFCVFVSFFPQLVAGPIERAGTLLPQFTKKRSIEEIDVVQGLRQILWGLVKKVVIADNCAVFVDIIFNNYSNSYGAILWLGMLLFSIQIYCDFSGYSDIAIGLARILGIKLSCNFKTPYFAYSIQTFWQRWHITLSTWFRDYVYFPLGGNRVGVFKKYRNIFITFIVSGLWHGANWTFVVWGILHGCFYSLEKAIGHIQVSNFTKVKYICHMLFTFTLVSFAWVIFRSESIEGALGYLAHLFVVPDISLDIYFTRFQFDTYLLIFTLVSIIIVMSIEFINRESSFGLERVGKNVVFRFLVYLVLSLLVVEFMMQDVPFIYFQF